VGAAEVVEAAEGEVEEQQGEQGEERKLDLAVVLPR